MIDGSKKCKCQWAFELQNLHVFEKRSKIHLDVSIIIKNGGCMIMHEAQ